MPSPQYGLEGPTSTGIEVEERERGDLDPGDGQRDPGGGSVLERQQDAGDQDGDEAREVLRLGERLEHAGRRVDAQVVEDGEVEDQERQQGAGQAEQQARGVPGGRGVWVVLRKLVMGRT